MAGNITDISQVVKTTFIWILARDWTTYLYVVEDNLLTPDGHISQHDIIPEANMKIFLMHLRIL